MIFDPVLRGRSNISKFNYGFEKKKSVDIVRWLEKGPNRPSSSRFLVVFSDGMIAFYHKDRDVPSGMQETKDGSKLTVGPYDPDRDFLRYDNDKQ
jgi:hypothetical protein